jgi:hypothetical protein
MVRFRYLRNLTVLHRLRVSNAAQADRNQPSQRKKLSRKKKKPKRDRRQQPKG